MSAQQHDQTRLQSYMLKWWLPYLFSNYQCQKNTIINYLNHARDVMAHYKLVNKMPRIDLPIAQLGKNMYALTVKITIFQQYAVKLILWMHLLHMWNISLIMIILIVIIIDSNNWFSPTTLRRSLIPFNLYYKQWHNPQFFWADWYIHQHWCWAEKSSKFVPLVWITYMETH